MALKPKKSQKSAKQLPHVLLVEDDAILALALEDALLEAGTKEVVVCQTMQATMRALNDGPKPDAIVIDVHLADRDDGWAIAELVTFLGPRPPRIIFSTGSPEAIPQEIAELGVIFEKPYDPEELVAALVSERKSGPFALLRR